MWDLIVSIPDLCLSFYFSDQGYNNGQQFFRLSLIFVRFVQDSLVAIYCERAVLLAFRLCCFILDVVLGAMFVSAGYGILLFHSLSSF